MGNRILQIAIRDVSFNPVEAEVWITVTPERMTSATELRGRLMGPRCLYASTVEVAYPLRSLPPGRTSGSSSLTMRVVIPEASLWEPESPFYYQGPVELWQDGRRCETITLRHGLRSFQLGVGRVRINGRSRALRGRFVRNCSEEDCRALRQAGVNLLVVPVEANTMSLWEMADRFGFLLLGQVNGTSEAIRRQLPILAQHASFLGWILEEESQLAPELLPSGCLLGLSWSSAERNPPEGVAHFLFGPAELAGFAMPLLIRGSGENEVPKENTMGIVYPFSIR